MKRSPINRKTRIRARRTTPRDRGDCSWPEYIAFLRGQPCRVPGCIGKSEAHHLRHDENGASIGGRIKDDRRAISLCHFHHIYRLHQAPHLLRMELKVDDLKEWQNQQLASQREAWEKRNSYTDVVPF